MARAATKTKTVDLELTAKAIAFAVSTGDIVNFKFIFSGLSPVRAWTSDILETEKYIYLLPDAATQETVAFKEAYDAVKITKTWEYMKGELNEKRNAQLPSELVLMIADNAVRAAKYTMAAQAYELLRLRTKMRAEFFKQADGALAEGNIPKAVQGYRVATGLSYDAAAFPEPLPKVANYQSDALQIHGRYPENPQDSASVIPAEAHIDLTLNYLLGDPTAVARLKEYPIETRLAFVKELILRVDPQWDIYVERYHAACKLTLDFAKRMEHEKSTLEDEIDEQQGHIPTQIMEALLGRVIENGTWWQYLKDLAYEHPAGILFIARQRVGKHEILMPRLLAGSALPEVLGLSTALPEGA